MSDLPPFVTVPLNPSGTKSVEALTATGWTSMLLQAADGSHRVGLCLQWKELKGMVAIMTAEQVHQLIVDLTTREHQLKQDTKDSSYATKPH